MATRKRKLQKRAPHSKKAVAVAPEVGWALALARRYDLPDDLDAVLAWLIDLSRHANEAQRAKLVAAIPAAVSDVVDGVRPGAETRRTDHRNYIIAFALELLSEHRTFCELASHATAPISLDFLTDEHVRQLHRYALVRSPVFAERLAGEDTTVRRLFLGADPRRARGGMIFALTEILDGRKRKTSKHRVVRDFKRWLLAEPRAVPDLYGLLGARAKGAGPRSFVEAFVSALQGASDNK